jgi:hypothetical protein
VIGKEHLREGMRARWATALVGLIVFAVALLRQPMELVWEEPQHFWRSMPLWEPWAGYLQVVARGAFAVAYPLESVPLTRVLAAAVIALVAMFLASTRLSQAIPDRRVRIAFGVSLAFLPIAESYVGPLNSQWWLALLLVGIALTTERRWYDYPTIALAGLSGIGACLALPVFRDRRGLVLVAVVMLQAVYLIGAARRPSGIAISWQFAIVAALVVLAVLTPRLPRRTRFGFGWLSLVTIALGSWTIAGAEGGWRYLTAACAFVTLTVIAVAVSRLGPPTRWSLWGQGLGEMHQSEEDEEAR